VRILILLLLNRRGRPRWYVPGKRTSFTACPILYWLQNGLDWPRAYFGNLMTATRTTTFRKTAACPSEGVLVSYNSRKLSQEIMGLVRFHLGFCDFCSAELSLLSRHSRSHKVEAKTPEIPMNLRVLAESLLFRSDRKRKH